MSDKDSKALKEEKQALRDYGEGHRDAMAGNHMKGSSLGEILINTLPGNHGPSKHYEEGFRDGKEDRKKN